MNVIFSYNEVLNEMLGNAEEHANIIACASTFCNVQDGICFKSISDDNQSFDITFEYDGCDYRISGKLINGDVKICGIYRKSLDFDKDICCNYLSSESLEKALDTRNILDRTKAKIIRILKRIDD